MEVFLNRNLKDKYTFIVSDFIKRIDNVKRFNLDEESLMIYFKEKILNE